MLPYIKSKRETIFFIVVIILISFPVILPLIKSGFYKSDDGEWMIIRFTAFHQAIRDGQFPVRFLGRLNHNYGYPVANFLYPGFMYFAEIFKLLGFNFINSIKAVLIISTVGSGIFTYLWLSKLFKKLASLIGAIIYIYFPYHIYDIYKRGSVGENLALGILPLCLWLLEKNQFFLFTLSLSFLLISHNTLAVLFFPIIAVYTVLRFKNERLLLIKYLISFLLSIGMSLFFWMPAFYDLRYTVFFSTVVSEWDKYFANYDVVGVISFTIIAFIIIFFKRIMDWKTNEIYFAFLFIFLMVSSIFLSLSTSKFIWQFLPVSFVQFPFRFLSISVISASFIGAYIYSLINRFEKIVFVSLLIISIVTTFPFLIKSETFSVSDSFYTTNEATTTVKNEYMPIWVKEIPTERAQSKIEVKGRNNLDIITNKTNKIVLKTDGEKALLAVNTIYFPGWNAYIDGKLEQISYKNSRGRIELFIPYGSHKVNLVFKETDFRLISDVISIISFILLVGLSLKFTFYKQ